MENFTSVVFEKDELEYGEMSNLQAVYLFPAFQKSDSTVGNVIFEIPRTNSFAKLEAIDQLFDGELKQVDWKKTDV